MRRDLCVFAALLCACGDGTSGTPAQDIGGPEVGLADGADVGGDGEQGEPADGAMDTPDEGEADVSMDITPDADTGPDIAPDIPADPGQDTAPDTVVDVANDTAMDVTPDLPLDVFAEVDAAPEYDPWNITLFFDELGAGPDMAPVIKTELISLPPGFQVVEAQIAIRGDLDAFPMAFMALVVEQDGKLAQCADLAGLPQKPNNILDDVFRVAFPRPQNLASESIYYPPGEPYDFQLLPCQAAFSGKSEIELGLVTSDIYAPGVSGNQGESACGGEGCPNEAWVVLRFVPDPDPDPPCEPDDGVVCICTDGAFGDGTCLVGGDVSECQCPDAPGTDPEPTETEGSCSDGLPFSIGASSPTWSKTLPATALHAVPWPASSLACPQSKPPYSLEYYYEMEVTDAGTITFTLTPEPQPWDYDQHFIDIQLDCAVPWQCGPQSIPLQGMAMPGSYLIGVTLAPPYEIYIPDQDGWTFTLTAEWVPWNP